MAQKKSFKSALNNPAMQFITVPEEETVELEKIESIEEKIESPQVKKEPQRKTAPKTAAKKTKQEAEKERQNVTQKVEIKTAKAPEGYKINPMYVEVKSKRVQLVLQPSLFEKVKALAEKNGDSVNNTVHAILEQATADE